jgi:hypothetical protein
MPAQVRLFFINLLQVGLLTAVIVVLVFAAIQPDPAHYFAGSLLQLELLRNTPSPRIILIGGSNVSFGLDAELMQRKLGIPVINDGLHAGLGIAPLRELEEYLRPGDKVILSLEYNMFSYKSIMEGDNSFLSDWIEYFPQRVKYLPDPWKDTPSIYATMLQRKVNREVNRFLQGGSLDEVRSVFNGTKYNANGDFIGHLEEESTRPKKIPTVAYLAPTFQNDIFIFLEQFDQMAHARGVEVYFEPPASRRTNCEITSQNVMSLFFQTFEDRLSIPVITPLEEVCMPDKYFFDTPYHLNAEGRRLRTERLIQNWMQLTASAK